MASSRERNDRKSGRSNGYNPQENKGHGAGPRPAQPDRRRPKPVDPEGWLWGWHAVESALLNPDRDGAMRLLATAERARALEPIIARSGRSLRAEIIEAQELGRMLPQGAVHQGVALRTLPLEGVGVEDLAEGGARLLVVLDQITDPQNVGAIFRSAAAFGAGGVILQDRHAPALAGSLAKAAAGAVDKVPHARVVNLSRALEKLADLGWRAVGLDGSAPDSLDAVLDERPTVLVLGSEGEGLRRLVAEHCDVLAKIAMPGGFESLNVSNAAAIALYEVTRPRG